jgi:dsRNA-specific ribonuclease
MKSILLFITFVTYSESFHPKLATQTYSFIESVKSSRAAYITQTDLIFKGIHRCAVGSVRNVRRSFIAYSSRQQQISPGSLKKLEQSLGIEFKNITLLEQALTHRSVAKTTLDSNQRLEFLGDAVLGMVVADHLYQSYPHLKEGELTAMRKEVVNTQALAGVARAEGLGNWVLMSSLEDHTGGRKKESILADTTESIIAAVYLDQGLQTATGLILRWVGGLIQKAEPPSLSCQPRLSCARDRACRPQHSLGPRTAAPTLRGGSDPG